MEKLSSMKPIPGAKKAGDHWFRENMIETTEAYAFQVTQSLVLFYKLEDVIFVPHMLSSSPAPGPSYLSSSPQTQEANFCNLLTFLFQRASLIVQLVKNPSVMQETPVRFLGQEDLLEKG